MANIKTSIDLFRLMELSDAFSNLSPEEKSLVKERYIKFLRLSKKHFDVWLAPTVDIDELWHLHMLCPVHYYNDCSSYFGEILNHDYRGVQEPPKSREDIFQETNELWKNEFGEEMISDGVHKESAMYAIASSHGLSFRPPSIT